MKKIFGEDGVLSGKRVLSVACIFAICTACTGTAIAANSGIKSQGRIIYDNDTEDTNDDVIFDASDFTNLEAQVVTAINDVEKNKSDLLDNLNQKLPPSTSEELGDNPSWEDILKAIDSIGKGSTASGADVLVGKTFYNGTEMVTGTMPNNGTVNPSPLAAGESYTIPQGYHSGEGIVTTKSLASQTSGTAIADNLSDGVTAWVNGELITGTGADNNSYYSRGYQDGTADGLKHIYENEVFQKNYATVSCDVHTAVNYGQYSDSDSVHETYNIPLSTDKFLYAVQYDLTGNCSSNRQGVGSGEIKVQLKTTEGTIIGVGTWSGRCQDGQQDSSSKHIIIDLLATNFSTEGDHLLLDIFENASVSRITNDDSYAMVTLSCNNIVAKYK